MVGVDNVHLMYPDCIIVLIQNISVLWLCSDVMDYCRKVSRLEDSKNRDRLLKKLLHVCVLCVCVCVCVWVCVCMCVCVCVGRWVVKCVWVGV